MKFNDMIVIEWSVSQGCFHSYSVRDMVKNNQGVCLRGSHTDYIPIGFFDTEEESIKFMDEIRTSLKQYRYIERPLVRDSDIQIAIDAFEFITKMLKRLERGV